MRSVLVVGSGAREHALVWKLRQSPDVTTLYVAPGNAGTRMLARNVQIAATDVEGLVRFVEEGDIGLTVIGPEAPLALGLADGLRARGRLVVGPGAAAARIESSKAFAKDLMQRAGVPTAPYRVCDDARSAFRYLAEARFPLVIKADGLAAGKGVVVCHDIREARGAVEAIMVDRIHGESGSRVVMEEMLQGSEISLLALVDGERAVPLPVAQDHKRLCDGDAGPNTGGMGAFAPVPGTGEAERSRLVATVIDPIVQALSERGTPYRGVLFAGLMLTVDGPRVLEYNCRLGDPETQVIVPLLEGDLLPWLEAVAGGELGCEIPVPDRAAAGVVLAAPGYPEKPVLGARIEGLDEVPDDLLVFHAGTALDGDGAVVTAGGRVMTVVGQGPTVEAAAARAYAAQVRFEGVQRRSDIGRRRMAPPALSAVWEGEKRARIGVLASGDGSNLQAVLDGCAGGRIAAEVVAVVSHNRAAGALDRARRAGAAAIALELADRRDPAIRRRYEEDLLRALAPFELDLLVLAGWMLVLSAEFLERCGCPVINVHPALLPERGPGDRVGVAPRVANVQMTAAPGARGDDVPPVTLPVLRGPHAVRDAIALGLPVTGVSVHRVTPEVDAGPVLLSEAIDIWPGEDETSLYRRIKPIEHRLLVQAVIDVLASGGVHA